MATNFAPVGAQDASVVAGAEAAKPYNPDAKEHFNGQFSEKELVEQVTRKWDESDQRLRDYFQVALECWDDYRNKRDFSDKEDWQSRLNLPKAHAAVKQGVANVRKLFVQARDSVTVEDPSQRNAAFVPYVQEGVKQLWDKAGFLDVTSEGLEAGLIMGLLAVRHDWLFDDVFTIQPAVDPATGMPTVQTGFTKEGRFALRPIDPWNIRWGPETGPKKIDWIIEERVVSVPTLRKMGFDIPEDIAVEDSKQGEVEVHQRRRKDEIEAREQFEHRAKVWEYWGPLIDEKAQTILVDQAHVIIANKKRVVLAEYNPYWRQKPPYVLASPLRVAFRFPGQGILEVNRALKDAIDSIAQMGEDYLKFATLPMFEADMYALENPEDIATGIEPGKIFRKRPGANAIDAIRQVQVHPLQADVFNMLLTLDKEYQRSSFITEIVQGLLDVKGETTATEIQSTIAQSTIMLASIARDLEEQYLEPLADATWDYALQFMDITSNPSWEKILGPQGRQLDVLPRAVRLGLVQGNYSFKARGISLQVERQAELTKLINYLSVIGQYAPQFVPLLNMPEIFRRIHESFSFPRYNELLAPNAAMLFPAMQRNMMLQESPEEQFAAKAGQELVSGLIQNVVEQNKLAARPSKPNGGERK